MKIILTALFMLLSLPVSAGEDHDRIRRAVLAGKILPLSRILEQVDRDYPGELIEAELEDKHGRPVYEIKRLTHDGRLLKLYYDAADGTRLKVKEKR
ncbi:PepSY domain-containing protein [Paramagnetospirillum magneticum]|uniref:Predicted membrane protein n=1 Tax=Paramagnetospirillum magneticum (strain ATCC 700264 / AMB-1) TaxID=342108 RepID=Q2WAY1_PARM1|nr:PepSY domain-containing protein [Paramagnetospirillum magneticum]BAE48994.1 Predicted membrane protein [Paramagnetospirillum magneticum AMB-1]